MFSQFTSPEKILADLGIEEPEDLDLEAIAMACGATVIYQSLTGSDARIIGHDDHAIITVRDSEMPERQRFSIAHELGHWMRDRGKVAFSCQADGFLKGWSDNHPEIRANRFASELLLPKQMIQARTRGMRLTWANVRAIANVFKTSLTATAIRMAQIGDKPGMLVCTSPKKREWFVRHQKLVPETFWPHKQPMQGSLAFEMHKSSEKMKSGEVSADAWIDTEDASEYQLWEDSVRVTPDTVLTLLEWRNERQLVRYFSRSH